ncbi:MAG: response regulator [Heliobacteriaceae bacterium]|nr:response regulator [Heliobacteriaceae bacterium]MDD4588206.1 response regulator [Heliobacteriaceae bacterium]
MVLKDDYLLIVDDHDGVRRLLYEIFHTGEYGVEAVPSGEEALERIAISKPWLVLLDVRMPGMSGIDTLKELKKLAPEVPVVVLSAYTELDTTLKAKESGLVEHYVSKPFDLETIQQIVKGILVKMQQKNRGNDQTIAK